MVCQRATKLGHGALVTFGFKRTASEYAEYASKSNKSQPSLTFKMRRKPMLQAIKVERTPRYSSTTTTAAPVTEHDRLKNRFSNKSITLTWPSNTMILLIFATSVFHSEATSKHIVSSGEPVVMVGSMLVGILWAFNPTDQFQTVFRRMGRVHMSSKCALQRL